MSSEKAVYPDSITTEYFNGTTWVDLSAYVVSDISGSQGFSSSLPDDRVAFMGSISLELNNKNGLFSPMGGDEIKGLSTLTGFNKGAKIRVKVLTDSYDKVIFIGRISSINTNDGTWGKQRVKIIADDWMDIPARYPMKGTQIETDKTIDYAMSSILERLSIQPEATIFDAGNNNFPTIFDGVKDKTKASGEFNKLALSELGYIYLLKDGTLRVENFSARNGTRDLEVVPVHTDIVGNLLLEDGDSFLLEDGNSLILQDAEHMDISQSSQSLTIELEDEIINNAYTKAYPTRTDTSLTTVFRLGSPIFIAGKTTIYFTGNYTDSVSGESINATNLQTPTITVDYLMNSSKDGSGSNLSSDLVVSATYYGDMVEYALTNNNSVGAWITRLNARGYAIYKTSPIQSVSTDESSIEKYGETTIEIDQKYQGDFYAGNAYTRTIVEEFKNPRSRVIDATFLANLNSSHLMAFLFLEVGSLIKIYENRSQTYKHYYITSISFNMTLGKIIHVTYGLSESNSLLSDGLKQLKTRFSAPGRILDYGYIPSASNLNKITISTWVYLYTIAGRLVWNLTNSDGFSFGVGGTNQLQWYQQHSSIVGIWTTPNNSITTNTLYHCVITRDTSINPTEDPKIYINGVLQTLTEVATPVGTINSDMGLNLRIGNKTMIADIQDPRVYNRVLSQNEITALYNSGTPDKFAVTDDLVFQGLCMYADDVTATMESNGYQPEINSKMIDNIKRYVGDVKELRGWSKLYPGNSQGWLDVAWSPELGLFAACTDNGTGRIMTSPNGVDWTVRTTTGNPALYAITWSSQKGIFVTVGANAVMTSTDGITWTPRTPVGDFTNNWGGITYSPTLGIFAACSISSISSSNRIMTSTDGITWTGRTCPSGSFQDIVWGGNMFVAVRVTGTSTRVIYSYDGINWGNTATPASLDSSDVYSVTHLSTFGFLAVGTNCAMYSVNGLSWTEITLPVSGSWKDVVWSPELGKFYAVADAGTYRLMSSTNGTTWTEELAVVDNGWYGLVWSPERRMFVAVAYSGTNERVMIY